MAEPLPEERFWMVCRMPSHRNSKTEPKQRYVTRLAADQAARDLAAQSGANFAVLEVVNVVGPRDRLTDHGLFPMGAG